MENETRNLINTFNEQQLRRLKCSDEEINIVMKYQRLLPILCNENDVEKFCVDARTLHEQLGGSQNRNFSHWIKANLQLFEIDKDYIKNTLKTAKNGVFVFKDEKPKGGRPSIDYLLTLDTAKEISMLTGLSNGASEELKRRSKLARRYFILMEHLVKDNSFWEMVREQTKKGYKPMDEALTEYIERNLHREADHWDYRREANILNIIAFGYKAQEIRLLRGIFQHHATRDYLTKEENEFLKELQNLNSTLLEADVEDTLRYNILYSNLCNKYGDKYKASNDEQTIKLHRKQIGIKVKE